MFDPLLTDMPRSFSYRSFKECNFIEDSGVFLPPTLLLLSMMLIIFIKLGDVVFYHDRTGMPKRKMEGTEFPPTPK